MGSDILNRKFECISEGDCKKVLEDFLVKYTNPSFGCHPKKEIDLLVLEMLKQLGVIKSEPTLYDLVTELRIPRTKARSYLYELELRGFKTTEELDAKLKKVILNPVIQKKSSGGSKAADFMFVIEIENPLLIDHIRNILTPKGHAIDSSFSPTLVKITLDAMICLIEKCAGKESVAQVEANLKKAGIEDPKNKGILKSILFQYANKYLGDAGPEVLESISEYISPFFDDVTTEKIFEKLKNLFPGSDGGVQ